MSYQATLESATVGDFKISPCLNIESEVINDDICNDLATIKGKIFPKEYKSFKTCIIRASFFVQASNAEANGKDAPKCVVRWDNSLRNDPRFASYEQCEAICQKIIHAIATCSDANLDFLRRYCKYSTFREALPIDYIRKTAQPIHSSSNIKVFMDPEIQSYVLTKEIIFNSEINPDVDLFKRIYKDKIQVKAYKTDRAQTGDFKTNREFRWETRPGNFQFAYRRDCDSVENKLILLVCSFDGVSPTLVSALQKEGLLPISFEPYRCPITGDLFKFDSFQYEVRNPEHGRALFQIGHMSPLKLGGIHNGDNVAWVSEDGNRIQGDLSEGQVKELLIRIFRNRPDIRPQF